MTRSDKMQARIRAALRSERVQTQEALAELLQCGTATISRHAAKMGLAKCADGYYVLSEDMGLQQLASAFVTGCDYALNLVVVKCSKGVAPAVADAIDGTRFPGILGSVGDGDTVMVACRTEDDAQGVAGLVNLLRSE